MGETGYTPRTYDELDPDRRPSGLQALIPVLAVVAFLGLGSGWLGMDPHAPLLWSIVAVGAFGLWLGYDWEELLGGISNGLQMGLQALLILFAIYGLIATWVSAGTIPVIMHYGLELLSPTVFLPAAALLAFVVAFAIGSSWTTVGTLGVAFVGVGAGLGVPAPMTVGAIISGAYAGDKQSPLSDTTNLAAGVTNTNLYDHIRAMRFGTAVSFGLSLLAFAGLGVAFVSGGATGDVAAIQSALAGSFSLSVLALFPLAVTFGLALRGYPALPALVGGIFAGVFTTIALQGAGFVEAWDVFLYGVTPETGSKTVNGLLEAGGLAGSAWTITVVVAALVLGGLLEQTGTLATLANHLASKVTSRGGLIAGTGASAILTNALTAQQYMSIVLPSLTLKNTYEGLDLDSSDLSRAVEAAGTPTGALIPWHAGALFMSGATGVATLEYAPFYLFGLLSPAVLFAMAFTGFGLPETPAEERRRSGAAVPTDD